MKSSLIIFLISLLCLQSFAAPADNAIQNGNASYQRKAYDSAVSYYEQALKTNANSAVLHYNLGNAYYRLNEIGPSVLHYQKALHLKADYKEAADNLSLAESRIGNRVQTVPDIFFVQWWKSITQGSKANMWAIAALILFLAWIAILIAKRFNHIQYIAPQLHIAIGLVLFLLLSVSLVSALNKQDSAMAVVMNNDTPFMASPQSGKPQSLLPEGTTIKWKTTEGKWVNIVLPDGRTGWIEADNLAKI